MPERTTQILEEALQLPPTERAAIIEQLVSSLHRPDPRIDALWAQEAKERIAAFESGQMEAFPAEDVFAELEQP
jgi:putative addiction module component (TIGR02574 family)